MKNLKEQLQEFMAFQDKERSTEHKAKDSFWASESEKSLFDLYHGWIGTPATNPPDAEKLVMFNAGKMIELAVVETLQKMGVLKKFENDEQMHFNITRADVAVSGYMDGIFELDSSPLEIKSFYGDYQARELEAGKPRVSYLKQLAIYMDATNSIRGTLLYVDRGTGKMYEFDLLREGMGTALGSVYHCGKINFDLNETYERWAKMYKENVVTRMEPGATENGLYKQPIDQIDWSQYSVSVIGDARNNRKVIGSDKENGWKNLYSPFLDLILQRQGTQRGYTPEELAQIKLATKGFSSKK